MRQCGWCKKIKHEHLDTWEQVGAEFWPQAQKAICKNCLIKIHKDYIRRKEHKELSDEEILKILSNYW